MGRVSVNLCSAGCVDRRAGKGSETRGGLLAPKAAAEMRQWDRTWVAHKLRTGSPLHAGLRTEARDRKGLET